MLKQKLKFKYSNKLAAVAVAALLLVGGPVVHAVTGQDLQRQIDELNQQNSQTQQTVNQLAVEANSYQDAVNKLQVRINGVRREIAASQNRQTELQRQIEQAEADLIKQKQVLGESIKAMYLEGDISTLEILASSKNLSEFVDKQQYRNAVQNKIKTTVDKINELKAQLVSQKKDIDRLLAEQNALNGQLTADEQQTSQLLSYTEGQKAAYSQQIKNNNNKIADLRRQQALLNLRLFGGGSGQLGGGGYPWGYAKCLHTGAVEGWCDNYDWAVGGSIWNFATGGYGYRNCTDWVAWKIRVSGGWVPGGLGNANTWDDRGDAMGYTVSSTPKAGAAAVSNSGYYGHVMYVEAVNEDGSILISDYNRAGTGKYSLSTINPSGLRFVYF